jgi:hypothetical protein
VIHIDLVGAPQGRAWVDGSGEVAVDTLLGTDPNSDNGWGATGYVSADLTADGLVYYDSPPALIGSVLTKVLAAATVVVKLKQITETFQTHWPLILLASEGSEAVELDLAADQAVVRSFSNYSGAHSIAITSIVNAGIGAVNCAAMTVNTVAGTRFDIAVNGSAAIAGDLTGEGWPPAQAMAVVVVDPGIGQNMALQSITIYDPLSDTSGLSALSETGVTNTAPTLAGEFYGSNITFGGVGGETPQISEEFTLGTSADVMTYSASDPEGNPLIISLSDDNSGIFAIAPASGNPLFSTVTINNAAAGDYFFTVRATDPGGLYVEQEFTITVTA